MERFFPTTAVEAVPQYFFWEDRYISRGGGFFSLLLFLSLRPFFTLDTGNSLGTGISAARGGLRLGRLLVSIGGGYPYLPFLTEGEYR